MKKQEDKIHTDRIKKLIEKIATKTQTDNFVLLIPSAYDSCDGDFRQESNFYYLTGIKSSGTILLADKKDIYLFFPRFKKERGIWLNEERERIPWENSETTIVGTKRMKLFSRKYL